MVAVLCDARSFWQQAIRVSSSKEFLDKLLGSALVLQRYTYQLGESSQEQPVPKRTNNKEVANHHHQPGYHKKRSMCAGVQPKLQDKLHLLIKYYLI